MSIDPQTYCLPDESQPVETYMTEFGRLDKLAIGYDKSLGRIRWLQGRLLLLARKRVTRRGEWKDLLASFGIHAQTAFKLRKIAEAIPEERSHTMGYDDMLAVVYDCYAARKRRIKAGMAKDITGEMFYDEEPADKPDDKPLTNAASSQCVTIDKIKAALTTYARGLQRLRQAKLIPSKLNPRDVAAAYHEVVTLAERISRDAQRIKALAESGSKQKGRAKRSKAA